MSRVVALTFLIMTACAATPSFKLDTAEAAPAIKPNIFGTAVLSLPSTPLDSKWNTARGGKLSSEDHQWANSLKDRPSHERIVAINNRVNAAVRYTADKGDSWQNAATTLRSGRGDCEDYALAKLALLEAAGFARADLILTLAHDLVLRVDHAMLVVRDGNELLLLNNLTNRIVDARTAADYRPIFSYSAAGQKWLHGYARTSQASLAPSRSAP